MALRDLAGEQGRRQADHARAPDGSRPLAVTAPFATEAASRFELGRSLCDLDAKLHEGALAEVRASDPPGGDPGGRGVRLRRAPGCRRRARGNWPARRHPGAGPAPHGRQMDPRPGSAWDGRIRKLVFAVPRVPGGSCPSTSWRSDIASGRRSWSRGPVGARHAGEASVELFGRRRRPLRCSGCSTGHAIELHTGRQPASVEDDGLVLVPNYRQRLRCGPCREPAAANRPRPAGLARRSGGFRPYGQHSRVPDASRRLRGR